MQGGLKERSFEKLQTEGRNEEQRSGFGKKLEGINIPQKVSNFYVKTSYKPSTQSQTTREESQSQSSALLPPKVLKKSLKVDIPNNSMEIFSKTWSQFSPKMGETGLTFKKGDFVKLESNSKFSAAKRNKYEEDVRQLDKWQAEKKKFKSKLFQQDNVPINSNSI